MEHIRINDYLRLEGVKLSMANIIYEAINHDRSFLRRWLPFVDFTQEISDTENFLKNVVKQKGNRKDEVFSIWYKEEFAGLIGFKDTDWINRKTELGYWITENMQGKGIVTSSVKKLTDYAFHKLSLNRVQIKTGVGNEKSASIPRRLGFQFEGVEREGELHSDSFIDLEIFSILKNEWKISIK